MQILGDYRGPYQLNKSIVDAVSGEEVIIENQTLNNINNFIINSAQDYNKRIDKDMEGLSPALTLKTVSDSDQIDYGNYIGQTFMTIAPSVAVSFSPVLGALRAGSILSAVGKVPLGSAALKVAKQRAQDALIASTRFTQGMFFAAETGGQLKNLRNQLENSYKIKGSFSDQLKELNLNINVLESKSEKTEDNIISLNNLKNERDNIQNAYNDQDDIQKLTRLQKSLNAYSYGIAATFFETFGTIKLLNDPVRDFIKKYGREQVKRKSYKGIGKYIQATKAFTSVAGKFAVKALTIENLEEYLTLGSQNIFDIYMLGENKAVTDGMTPDFFAQNSLSIFTLVGGRTVNSGFSAFKAEFNTANEIKATRIRVFKALNLHSKILNGNFSSAQSKKAYKELETIVDELAVSEGINFWKLSKNTSEEILDAADRRRQQREIIKNAQGVGLEGGLQTKQEVEDLLIELKDRFNILDTEANNILNKFEKDQDKRFKVWKDASKLDPRVSKGTDANVDISYEFGKNEYFNGILGALSNNKQGRFSTIEEFEKMINENNFTDEQKEKLYEDFVTLDKEGKKVLRLAGSAFGKKTDYGWTFQNQYAINAGMTGGKKFAATTPLEELFHEYNINKKIATVNKDGKLVLNEDAVLAINELIKKVASDSSLGRIDKAKADTVIERFNQYLDPDSDIGYDAEEILVQLNNAVVQGLLNKSFFIYVIFMK